MSLKRQTYDWSMNTPEEKQWVYKRMLCVAFYDYVNKHIPIKPDNEKQIKMFLEIFFNDPNISVIPFSQWLLNSQNKPNTWELALMYSEMKIPSTYYRKLTGQKNSSILQFKGQRIFHCQQLLTPSQMIQVQVRLNNITWTKFDYTIFHIIEWANVGGE